MTEELKDKIKVVKDYLCNGMDFYAIEEKMKINDLKVFLEEHLEEFKDIHFIWRG